MEFNNGFNYTGRQTLKNHMCIIKNEDNSFFIYEYSDQYPFLDVIQTIYSVEEQIESHSFRVTSRNYTKNNETILYETYCYDNCGNVLITHRESSCYHILRSAFVCLENGKVLTEEVLANLPDEVVSLHIVNGKDLVDQKGCNQNSKYLAPLNGLACFPSNWIQNSFEHLKTVQHYVDHAKYFKQYQKIYRK